jgi:hypothetical protein
VVEIRQQGSRPEAFSFPERVRVAVESLDHLLKSEPEAIEGGQAN